MKINGILKATALTTALISGLSSCERKSYKLVPSEKVSKTLQLKLDSFSSASKNVINDTSYRFYAADTVKIDSTILTNPKQFFSSLQTKAKKRTGQFIESSEVKLTPMFFNGKMEMYPVVEYQYADKFLHPQAVLKNTKVYTTNNKDRYIPVEYYGIPNPKMKNSKDK